MVSRSSIAFQIKMPPRKERNPVAKDLKNFKGKVKPSKKKYSRKAKPKNGE
jgi:hypothetical protein